MDPERNNPSACSNRKSLQQQRPEVGEFRCTEKSHPKDGQNSADEKVYQESPKSPQPQPSCVSMKSNWSKSEPLRFKDGQSSSGKTHQEKAKCSYPSSVSMKSNWSKSEPLRFKDGQSGSENIDLGDKCESDSFSCGHKTPKDMDYIFILLEENIAGFVKTELKRIQRILSQDDSEYLETGSEVEEMGDIKKKKQLRSSRTAFLEITLHFLRRMNQEELAESLQSKTYTINCQRKLKCNLKKKFQVVFEGVAKAGNPTLLNEIYTELYITEGETGKINNEHEIRQIEAVFRKRDKIETTIRCEDIFKLSPTRDEPIRIVLTKGVAGIGKTVLTQKYTLDWAEDKANQDIQFIFPFTFRELNVLKEKKFSLKKLLHHFFSETKGETYNYDKPQVVFIFDGLDECRLPLDFKHNKTLSDVTKSTSLDVLLTNLISGKLLPSARLWITTRPAAANQIPAECVHMLTEVRGFTNSQKEAYFQKRFKDKMQGSIVLQNIKRSRSLHIMCHIPVFCWITATVLEDVLITREGGQLPKTLTEMYIHFLVVQAKLKNIKYDGGAETDPHWSPETIKMTESLGKLAFDQLQKGNLIFYESDLTECGIDIRAASVYSGVFTQIFKEERGLYQEKVFCFVHLSVQEFLAALHVHLTFINSGVNLLSDVQSKSKWSGLLNKDNTYAKFYQSAVDKALQSPNGHLDLFLRFLLGLSLETNQALLAGSAMPAQQGSCSKVNQKTNQYIKKIIRKKISPERSINLFHCLNELHDSSLVEEIQQSLRSRSLSSNQLSRAHWSALIFILLSSEEDLDVFDLKKYSASEEALQRLLPVVKTSSTALLSGCKLTEKSCSFLATVFNSQSCNLTKLNLSNNNLQDPGVISLCAGLRSPYCQVKTLRLEQTSLTEACCEDLSSVLSTQSSSLINLSLNYNKLEDSGVKLLSVGLGSLQCKLEVLRLVACDLSTVSCGILTSVLNFQSSRLTELDMSFNCLQDSGVKQLCVGLQSPYCRLKTLSLSYCGLSEKSCGYLASAVRVCHLTVLDLSSNDLLDSGVVMLSAGLRNPYCKLKALSLSGCQITEKGCPSLASALTSNPIHLQELDLNYNHLGDFGAMLLTAKLEDPQCRLETLRLDHSGAQRLKTDLRKYACCLTLDNNTVHKNLALKPDKKTVLGSKQPVLQSRWEFLPFTPDIFYNWEQALCTEGLTGRCYWEVKWRGIVSIGVTYKGIQRKGEDKSYWLGGNERSWILLCHRDNYSVWHNYSQKEIPFRPSNKGSCFRIGVYMDWPAGILSFFDVSTDTRIHLHTFHCKFTEPLYPALWFWFTVEMHKCSAALCDLQEWE
ncbi:NACHT, LRR and PYD domains-containing protein 12-like isoform X2 [Astatotilapia calliptera]|uniref:B30.2/SPRY domain-containing protein n=1 Tax=Astatotilapia calliptera TaxID=8154 RepID=A0AAX7SEX1_ASTCA|nr:NACHT, LRR and PYD domains-containing protein 12-like isoform X2 [Astatotilapia calliptera]